MRHTKELFSLDGKVAIVTYGILSSEVLDAKEMLENDGVRVDFIKLNKISPVSNDLVKLLDSYEKVYFFEEGIRKGSVSCNIAALVSSAKTDITAINEEFIPQMSVAAGLKYCKLDAESIYKKIKGEID